MPKSRVAIVGRPNVGKSTLFNRIIGRREAIVDDRPGVTRDRKYAEASWEGRSFLLVDTGGFVPDAQDTVSAGVAAHVRVAIEEADLVLFVVDANTGITDIDGKVADLLRKQGKLCLLVVNKADTLDREWEAAQFYRLGMGDIYPVSAISGRGVGDLLSAVTMHLPRSETDHTEGASPRFSLAVVGRPNTGKSTFINAVLGDERLLVTEIPGTTRDAVDVDVQLEGEVIRLIDTAGLRRRTRVKEDLEYYSGVRTRRAIASCDVACVFTDASEGLTQQDLAVVEEVLRRNKGVLLILNKWDLVKSDPSRIAALRQEVAEKLHGLEFIPVLEVSSLTGFHTRAVLKRALRIACELEKRISSPELNRILEEIQARFTPPAIHGKRIHIGYGVQIGVKPPRFIFFANHPRLLSDTYKRFMAHQIRERFGFEGVPISMVFRGKNKEKTKKR